MTKSSHSNGWLAFFASLYHRRPIPVLGAVAAVLAVIFVVATPLNVAARIGSYPGIGWVLHTYMKNWSRNWSVGIRPPAYVDMSDPALVRLGAGHFESGCAPCHGAPGRDRNPLVHMMEPPPPSLGSKVGDFSDRQLYWILWNGVRYSGMPGWTGADREDEIWAMVAFLRQYPELAPQDYIEEAYGDDVRPHGLDGGKMSFGGLDDRLDATMQNCARCHGADGMGRDGTAPKIAGQSAEYLAATLQAYASGKRSSGFMQPIAAPLSQEEIATLAANFASMRPSAERPDASGAGASPTDVQNADGQNANDLMALGRQLATAGDPSRFIPSCNSCHEANGGVSPRPEYPQIAGQDRRFLAGWLGVYRDRPLGGTAFATVMHYAAKGLTDRDIDALAAWYSSQPYEARMVDGRQARSPDATDSATIVNP